MIKPNVSDREIVDVVDEKGTILYQIPKVEAHAKGLLHRCVVAEVINSKGEMMLIKPYSYKQDAGQYVSPVGGHISAGETEEEALKREVSEEIGISVVQFKRVGQSIFDRKVLGRHENHLFILFEVFSDQKPQLGEEAQFYKYFTKEELQSALKDTREEFGDAFLFVVNAFYKSLINS